MKTRLHKVREHRSPYGYRWPLIPRRIGLALRRGRPAYPQWFYKWPERTFMRLFSE